MWTRPILAISIVVALLMPAVAGASDQPLVGTKLLLVAKEGKEQKRRVYVSAKDDRLSLGDGAASADDPTIHGGRLRIFSAAAGVDDTYELPASGWKPFSKKDPAKGWKYAKGNPIKKVVVKAGKLLEVLGSGPALGHTLESDPNPVGVELWLGARRYCLGFGGETKYRDGRQYKAKKAPEPVACSGAATTTSTTPSTSTSTIATTTSSSAPPTTVATSTSVTTTIASSTTTTTNQPPEIVSTPPVGDVLLDEITHPVDLSTWTSVLSTATSSGGNPNWQVASDGLSVLQTQNSNPGFFLSDFDVVDAVLDGTFRVETTGDDDIIGFVFGFQDVNHFYLFDWKQTDQDFCDGFADAGMTVKVVHADTDLTCLDLWVTDGQPSRVTALYHNTIPWQDNTTYGFSLDFEPGTIRVVIREGETVLDTITVQDPTYASGLFGFYNNSQNAVRYTGFTETTVVPGFFTYDVDAEDPEGDPITYSLTQAPAGMTIDPVTGVIEWMPGGIDLGGHDVTVRASAQGGFDEQTFTIVIALNPAPADT